ncbi:hypothetical protein RCO28_08445 [Streptomyces sp. LHD-70]|uniref:hypothetical protein n=1 Tax=Streptomyces sp. LHD-70 TaxID=3072140 RepID=UPI00280C87A0|nr:hypothetical protein [Streptomyces sp. LHD-70]MDQ8702522.1 hypothetical protein [Streptomyces sp. LHD-70]
MSWKRLLPDGKGPGRFGGDPAAAYAGLLFERDDVHYAGARMDYGRESIVRDDWKKVF